MIPIIPLVNVKSKSPKSYLIFREFFVYDLCFGEYPQILFNRYPNQVPTLNSFFPLYAFSQEHQRIFSFGEEKNVFLPSRTKVDSIFKSTPQSLLFSEFSESWRSNFISLYDDLPFLSQIFVYRFDMISNIKRKENVMRNTSLECVLFSINFETENGTFIFSLSINIFLGAEYTDIFTGFAELSISGELDGVEVASRIFNIQILENRINSSNPEWINRMKNGSDYFNSKMREFGFYQILSPQTIIIKVSTTSFLNQRWTAAK